MHTACLADPTSSQLDAESLRLLAPDMRDTVTHVRAMSVWLVYQSAKNCMKTANNRRNYPNMTNASEGVGRRDTEDRKEQLNGMRWIAHVQITLNALDGLI